MHKRSGKYYLIFSVFTRASVILMLVLFALWTEYANLKVGYNRARLVELAHGKTARIFYEYSESFFGFFGDPLSAFQKNGGMTWSVQVAGIPFSDPVAGLSLLVKNHGLTLEFMLGLIIPLVLCLLLGRVFCSYICPASLVFFMVSRVRRLFLKVLWFPDIQLNRGVAWGVLFGGLCMAFWFGHGIWTLILPYFGMGQVIFQGIATGVISLSLLSVFLFALVDLFLGQQFTCRYLCPTGRLLGWIGSRSLVSIKRDEKNCVQSCVTCEMVCPFKVSPKKDETKDCSLCGECVAVCPTGCLSIGRVERKS